MIRWLVENVGLMLLALIIAMVVWIAAEWEEDPIVEADYGQPIPVRVVNQPPDTYLVPGWQQQVRVRLRAPQSVWERLSPERFEALLNLSPDPAPLEPGVYSVPVNVSVDLEPAVVLEAEPNYIEIELEAMRERLVPVAADVRWEPELGYQAGEPVVVSDTVRVRGPASQVDQVQQVVTGIISLRGVRDTVVEEAAALTPVDAEGRRVNGVTLDPERVQVRVPVSQKSNFKEMVVKPVILGQPAPDYQATRYSVNPPLVTVVGSSFVLGELPGFVTTVPISIEGRTEDVVERLALELPPGVATVSPNEPAVQVTIEIEPVRGSVTVTRTVTFQGLELNLVPVFSPEVVEVLLSGPRPRLSALLPEDVRVVLDLSGLRQGDKAQLEPVVVRPEGITVDSIIPRVIQVEIVRKPRATPTPVP